MQADLFQDVQLAEGQTEYQSMQISRHWRMNPQRYRLEGVRYSNGAVSLQARPARVEVDEEEDLASDHLGHQDKKAPAVYGV